MLNMLLLPFLLLHTTHLQQINPTSHDSVHLLSFRIATSPCMTQTKDNNLTNVVAKWIAMGCRPLNIVNDRGLRQVIQIASSNQSYSLPSWGTTASQIHDLYQNKKTTKVELLKNAKAIALTGNHWTFLNNHSYLWSKDRNRLSNSVVKAEWQVQLNFSMSCADFHEFLKKNPELLRVARGQLKYRFKRKEAEGNGILQATQL